MSSHPQVLGSTGSSCDTLKILVATDIHLGFMEKDGVRGKDAMNTFEEVLQTGVKNDVDFVLLGGDLFHENKPSRHCLQGAFELLRKYCLGDKPCQVEFLSDPSVNFGHTAFPIVNYGDPNYNISMPVFSIHGNHDDPSGQGNYCALDLLHAAGLVNYFGKCSTLDAIEISPLLLEKGSTRLALYGLGSIRDERLHRLFRTKAVKMLRPREQTGDWFNALVLHQNRAQHGLTNSIPEHFLDDFLDLVIWGHEHECLIEPAWSASQNFYITQPGSTVATSLSKGETREKHCALLLIQGHEFKIHKIKLETVRPFYFEDIVLSETQINPNSPDAVSKVESYCTEQVQRILAAAEREKRTNQRQPDKPLIRLRVDYTGGYEPFGIHRFGQKFVDCVANPKDIVFFHRQRNPCNSSVKGGCENTDEFSIDLRVEALDSTRVEDMVREYFLNANEVKQLQLLTERGMGDAIKEFVDKEEKDAIGALVKHQLTKTQEYLRKRNTSEDVLVEEIVRYKEERRKNVKQEQDEIAELMSRARASRPTPPHRNLDSTSDNEVNAAADSDDQLPSLGDDLDEPARKSVARGRGRGSRGTTDGANQKGSRGRGSSRGRGKATIQQELSWVTSSSATSFKVAAANHRNSFVSRDSGESDEECTIINTDSGDDVPSFRHKQSGGSRSISNSTVAKQTTASRDLPVTSNKRTAKGVSFNSNDESSDEFSCGIPQRKRKR